MFSVLLSTKNSEVNLTRHEFNVFIEPSDGNGMAFVVTVHT